MVSVRGGVIIAWTGHDGNKKEVKRYISVCISLFPKRKTLN